MILQLFFVVIAAYLWARLEIEIEGKNGWAAALPTWRIEKSIWLKVFLGGRPLTGYHFFAFLFIAFIFHLPALMVTPWTWALEMRTWGLIGLFWVIEDVLWFVAHPDFGWKGHNAEKATWHPYWFLGFPADHWGLCIGSIILIYWGSRL